MSQTPRVVSPERAKQATGAQVLGIILLSIGLAGIHWWLGVVALGVGILALGVAMEIG